MANTVIGAEVQVFINGKLFALCTAIRWSASTGRTAIAQIDQTNPAELAPGQTNIKGSVECVRLHEDGGLEGWGIAAPESDILYEKYFSMAVIYRTDAEDKVLLAIQDCAIVDQNWQVNAKGMLTGSFSFEGISWSSEAEQ